MVGIELTTVISQSVAIISGAHANNLSLMRDGRSSKKGDGK
jgi:hypothetical protein